MIDHQQLATEAASVAFAIAARYEHPAPIVLDSAEFFDVHAAVRGALTAQTASTGGAVPYHRVDISAEHTIHGTWVTPPEDGFPAKVGLITAVVELLSKDPIDQRALPAILSDLRHQIDDAAETDDAYISEVIFILIAQEG